LGKFVCYDLRTIFGTDQLSYETIITIDSLLIPADDFLSSNNFRNFEKWKDIKQQLFEDYFLGKPFKLDSKTQTEFIQYNPESYLTYLSLAEYYRSKNNYKKAIEFLDTALTKEQASIKEQTSIENLRNECIKQLSRN
jgi:tetratricopeptide (TPR) repeat protein